MLPLQTFVFFSAASFFSFGFLILVPNLQQNYWQRNYNKVNEIKTGTSDGLPLNCCNVLPYAQSLIYPKPAPN